MADHGWCRHDKNECRLAYLIWRHVAITCDECVRSPRFCMREAVLYSGERGYGNNRAMKGAFRKGWNARAAGDRRHANPYDGDPSWRRGRWTRGFGPAFERAWDCGWAWADHYALLGWLDDVETTLILAALGASRPECLQPGSGAEEVPGWSAPS